MTITADELAPHKLPIAFRTFDLIAVNTKYKRETKCNATPMTHGEVLTFKSKFTRHDDVDLMIREVL